MEPKSPLSRIAASQPVTAATTHADRMREVLVQLVLRRDFPLDTIFECFAREPNAPADIAADPAMEPLRLVARRIAETAVPPGTDVQASAAQLASQLQGGLFELWRSSSRSGMTAGQTVEIARSVVAAGATSMFEPRTGASSIGPFDLAERMIR